MIRKTIACLTLLFSIGAASAASAASEFATAIYNEVWHICTPGPAT